jgi:S-adenosyl methyltransferase
MPYTAVITGEGLPAVTDDWLRSTARPVKLAPIDTTVPNVARVWNYLVGGRDNFDADRRAAKQLVAVAPVMADVAPASRAFLRRVVRYLAGEAGVRQFLDIGTGIPTAGNTHEVAQSVAPECRIVYVDNDPVVLVHARALLRSSPEGVTSYIDADAREPGKIIASAQETLDFDQPVAIVMIDVLNFIEGTREVGEIIRTLLAAVAPGSYIALMQPAREESLLIAQRRWNQISPIPVWLRDRDEVASWLNGLELAGPGIVDVNEWRPADGDPQYPDGMPLYGVVARKP